jgi:hypothetical protein
MLGGRDSGRGVDFDGGGEKAKLCPGLVGMTRWVVLGHWRGTGVFFFSFFFWRGQGDELDCHHVKSDVFTGHRTGSAGH